MRVIRTTLKTCIAPSAGGNVLLAGLPRLIAKLHRPWPGGTDHSARALSLSVQEKDYGSAPTTQNGARRTLPAFAHHPGQSINRSMRENRLRFYRDNAGDNICSPVATNPTWSGLNNADREALARDGCPLWHMLLEELRPQIVAFSIAKAHLEDIAFDGLTEWDVLHSVRHKADGSLRRCPYDVQARWYNLGGERSLFVFGAAAQTPFGTLSGCERQKAGSAILEAWRDRR